MKRALILVCLSFLAVAPAIAADPSAPASSSAFDANGLAGELVVTVLGSAALVLWRRWQLSQERRKMILTFAEMAYGAVNEISRRTPNKLDDKAAIGLRHVLDLLSANGQKPLTPGETITVRTMFDAMHGNESARVGGAAAAAAQAAVSAANPPTPLAR